MSDESRQAGWIRQEAARRGNNMPEGEALERARRVIAGREAFARHLRARADATGPELARTLKETRTVGSAPQIASRDPIDDIKRASRIAREVRPARTQGRSPR
jgi:hypothetical protein